MRSHATGLAVCYAVQRYRYLDLMPCLPAELEYIGFAACFPSQPSGQLQAVHEAQHEDSVRVAQASARAHT